MFELRRSLVLAASAMRFFWNCEDIMAAIYPDQRVDLATFRHLDHALNRVRTHGWRYAAAYLHNQRVADATLQRVLFGEWSRHRMSGNRA